MNEYPPRVANILKLTESEDLYKTWDATLSLIKAKIIKFDVFGPKRLKTFETVLRDEMVENPGRFSARRGILAALSAATWIV